MLFLKALVLWCFQKTEWLFVSNPTGGIQADLQRFRRKAVRVRVKAILCGKAVISPALPVETENLKPFKWEGQIHHI